MKNKLFIFGLVLFVLLSFNVLADYNTWTTPNAFNTDLAGTSAYKFGYGFTINSTNNITQVDFIKGAGDTATTCYLYNAVGGPLSLITSKAFSGSNCSFAGTNFTPNTNYFIASGSASNWNLRYSNITSDYPLANSIDFKIITRVFTTTGASWTVEEVSSITTSFEQIITHFGSTTTNFELTLNNSYNHTQINNFTALFSQPSYPTIYTPTTIFSNSVENQTRKEDSAYSHKELSDEWKNKTVLYMTADVNATNNIVYDWSENKNNGTVSGVVWNETTKAFDILLNGTYINTNYISGRKDNYFIFSSFFTTNNVFVNSGGKQDSIGRYYGNDASGINFNGSSFCRFSLLNGTSYEVYGNFINNNTKVSTIWEYNSSHINCYFNGFIFYSNYVGNNIFLRENYTWAIGDRGISGIGSSGATLKGGVYKVIIGTNLTSSLASCLHYENCTGMFKEDGTQKLINTKVNASIVDINFTDMYSKNPENIQYRLTNGTYFTSWYNYLTNNTINLGNYYTDLYLEMKLSSNTSSTPIFNPYSLSMNTNTITTTNGTIYYPQNQIVDISIFNIDSNTFFNQSYSNINTSINLEAESWRSVLIIDAKTKITNVSILNFNASIVGIFPNFNVSNVSGYTTHYVNPGSYVINGRAQGYTFNSTSNISVSNLESNSTTLYFAPDELNITAKDYFTNISIQAFTVTVTHSSGYSEILSTTTGLVQFYGIDGSYNLSISTSGFSSDSAIVNLINSSRNYSFSLFPSNSVYIHIYDQSTGNLITQNVSMLFASQDVIFTNYTVNGGFFIANLSATNYTVTFSSTNYSLTSYDISVASGSTQSLDAFMLSDSYTDFVIYTIYDKNKKDLPLQSCSVLVSKIVGTSWETVYSLVSDVTGRVAFYFISGEKYRITFMKSGYQTQVIEFNPILFTSYDIFLDPEISANINYDYGNINIEYSPSSYNNNEISNFVIQFVNPSGSFDYFGYNITWTDGLGYHVVSDSSNNVYGDVLSSLVNITDASWGQYIYLTYYYKTASGELKLFTGSFYINDASGSEYTLFASKGNTYGVGMYERSLVGSLITLVFSGGISFFVGIVPATAFALLIYGVLIYIEFIPFWSAVISMIVLFFVFAWRSSS